MKKKQKNDVLLVNTPDGNLKRIELENYAIVGTTTERKAVKIDNIEGTIVDLIEIYCFLRSMCEQFEEFNPLVKQCYEDLKKEGSLKLEEETVYHVEKISRPGDDLFGKKGGNKDV